MEGDQLTNRMIGHMKRIAGPVNLLSLDVVAGALLSGAFAARVLDVRFEWYYWAVLGTSVWIMYTADHLVDAYRLGNEASTRRHLFVYRNFRFLSVFLVLLSAADLWMVMNYFGQEVLCFGAALGILSGLYFAALHLTRGRKVFFLRKEIIVALIYTAGLWGIPLMEMKGGLTATRGLLVTGFFMLALINTMLLSLLDYETDKLDRHQTFALTHGVQWTKKSILMLGSLVVLVSLAMVALQPGFILAAAMLLYLLMAGLMIFILNSHISSKHGLLARIHTEMVFWIPGLILLI